MNCLKLYQVENLTLYQKDCTEKCFSFQQVMLVSLVTRDPLAKPLMDPLETKDTKVCGRSRYGAVSDNDFPTIYNISLLGLPGVAGIGKDGRDGSPGDPGEPGEPGRVGRTGHHGPPGICDTSACQGASVAGKSSNPKNF